MDEEQLMKCLDIAESSPFWQEIKAKMQPEDSQLFDWQKTEE